MRINREQFNKWLRALKSGKYKQTKGTLQDKHGYCCLGVGCKVLIPEKKLEYQTKYDDKKEQEVSTGFLSGCMPDEQVYAPQWLQDISEDFSNRNKEGDTLTALNDSKGFTFKQIVKALQEAYPERKKAKLSTKKVLKKKK